MRLIDADELKEWMANWLKMDRYYHPYASNNNIPINELEDIIERMPTVDAVPVVHGRWIPTHERGMFSHPYSITYVCSECGYSFYTLAGMPPKTKYCPYCGARDEE